MEKYFDLLKLGGADIALSLIHIFSVGIVGGEISLDLEYSEDSHADVDMNVVMTGKGNFVEIQGTGEKSDFSPVELSQLLSAAEKGIKDILELEHKFLEEHSL